MEQTGETTEDATRPPGALESLLVLQDSDLHVDQLRFRRSHLPEHETLASLVQRERRIDEQVAAIAPPRGELMVRQEGLERSINEARSRILAIDARLRSGLVSSFRDQEAMSSEIDALGRRQRELEDEELEVMEALEPMESDLVRLQAERASIERDAASARSSVAAAQETIDAEIGRAASARAALAASVPPAMLEEYERLRARLDGVGVARLVRNTCSGCHLSLPATEIDRIRHAGPEEIFHCDQCGRILVP